MIDQIYNLIDTVFGTTSEELSVLHMMARAFLVYALGILLFFVNKHIAVERSSFDIILKLMIGSAFASAIVGASPYFATLGAIAFLVFLNWVLSLLTYYSPRIERILKGNIEILYEHGAINWQAMQNNLITKDDLVSVLRKDSIISFDQVDKIFLEKDGQIIVHRKNEQYD